MYAKAVLKFIIPVLSVSFLLAGCFGDDNDDSDHNDSDHNVSENYTFSVSGMEAEQLVTGNLNESQKKVIKVSYLPESSQLYRSRKMSVTLQEETGADELYPVEVPELSPPFHVENNECKDGVAKGDTCTFEIVYKPTSIAKDFFKEEDVSMKAGEQTFTWKMLGVPENIQEDVVSSSASAEELPIEVKNIVANSLNYQVWASDTQAQTFGVTLTNNTDDYVSDIFITNENPPKGVSYEKAKKDSCEKNTECKLDIAFTPANEAVEEGKMIPYIGGDSFIHFTYKGFKLAYNLGTASVTRYGKRFFVNPALDLGNYNQLVQNSRILQTWQKDNIVVSGGDAGLFISNNGGAVWRHVPGLSLVQSFLVRDDHIFISTKNLGLLVGKFDMSTGAITEKVTYDMSNSNLKSNDIRNVTVSPSEKYIFIATGDGLAVGKYDKSNVKIGTEAEDKKVEFKIYNKTSTISLPENVVTSVAFSKGENYVLASTTGGLSVGAYDKNTGEIGKITTYKEGEGKPLPSSNVNQVMVKDENEVLISTIKGLSIATLEENSDDDSKNGVLTFLKNYDQSGGLLHSNVKSVTVSGKNVFIANIKGVNVLQYTINKGKVEDEKILDSKVEGYTYSVFVTEKNHVWLSGFENLQGATFDSEDETFTNTHIMPGKSLPNPDVFSMTLSEDTNKRILISTYVGADLIHYNPDTRETSYELLEKSSDIFALVVKYALMVKNTLLFWKDFELVFVPFTINGDEKVTIQKDRAKTLSEDCNHVSTHGNHFYASTNSNGMHEGEVDSFDNFTTIQGAGNPITTPIGSGIWSSTIVGDRMLISTDNSGVGVGNFDTGTGGVTGIKLFNPCGGGSCKILSVLASNDANSDVGKKYALISSDGKGLYVARFKDSTEASDTADTLSNATQYTTDPNNGGLPDNKVYSTAVIGGKVMIATDGGLAIGDYDKDTGQITNINSYTIANGLPVNHVLGVVFLDDKEGNSKYALVATGRGLAITEF